MRRIAKEEGWEGKTAHVFCCIQQLKAEGESWDKINVIQIISLCGCVLQLRKRLGSNARQGLRKAFCELFALLNFGRPVLLLDCVSLCFLGLIIWENFDFHTYVIIPRQRNQDTIPKQHETENKELNVKFCPVFQQLFTRSDRHSHI